MNVHLNLFLRGCGLVALLTYIQRPRADRIEQWQAFDLVEQNNLAKRQRWLRLWDQRNTLSSVPGANYAPQSG